MWNIAEAGITKWKESNFIIQKRVKFWIPRKLLSETKRHLKKAWVYSDQNVVILGIKMSIVVHKV